MKHILVALLCLLTLGCSGKDDKNVAVKIDGSSTVYPISAAVAREFERVHGDVRVTVGYSGTGGGFQKFCAGDIDINDASRPISAEEEKRANDKGITYVELPVAFDGLSVVVNKENDFVDHLTVAELRKIWKVGSKVTRWNQIRPEWPNKEIKLYGPGVDSGTFDYFTEEINGKSRACRNDFSRSENDNVLVTGIAGDKYSLGFFGYVYLAENLDKIKAVPIDGGKGPVAPNMETINSGAYRPLARPIFIYVSKVSAKREEVQDFVRFYLRNAPKLVKEIGYVPLPQDMYDAGMDRFNAAATGKQDTGD